MEKQLIVFFDNFFPSVLLLENLTFDGILACGTIRGNQKYFPTLADDKNLKERDEHAFRVNERNVSVLKWWDNKPILWISSCHGSEKTCFPKIEKW